MLTNYEDDYDPKCYDDNDNEDSDDDDDAIPFYYTTRTMTMTIDDDYDNDDWAFEYDTLERRNKNSGLRLFQRVNQ